MNPESSVSAVVVCQKETSGLEHSLGALIPSSGEDTEIIVVGDGSPEDAGHFPRAGDRLRLELGRDVSLGEAINNGLRLASGEYIALVQESAVVDNRCISSLADFLTRHPEAAAAGGKVFQDDGEEPSSGKEDQASGAEHFIAHGSVSQAVGRLREHWDVMVPEIEVSMLHLSVVMVRRQALEDLGGTFFDPAFATLYGYADFFARAIVEGWKIYYVSTASARQRRQPRALEESYERLFKLEKDRFLFCFRNLERHALDRFVLDTSKDLLIMSIRKGGNTDDEPVSLRAFRDAWHWVRPQQAALLSQRDDGKTRKYVSTLSRLENTVGYYTHERTDIIDLVPSGARCIVDLGCGTGALGAALKRARPEIAVRGIEIVAEQGVLARQVLDDVLVGSVEDGVPEGWPVPDCVILADVVEHLMDPWQTVEKWSQALSPKGMMIMSLPNVMHRSVVSGLLRFRWDYEDAGILDRTHLRFFTRTTAMEMLEQAGMRVTRLVRLVNWVDVSTLMRPLIRLRMSQEDGGKIKRPGRDLQGLLADLHTTQFVLVAEKA